MKKPELNDFKRDVYDGADEAEWYREYYKALENYTEHLESTNKKLIDALGKLLKVSKSEVPEKYRNEYENVWEKSETALRDAGELK